MEGFLNEPKINSRLSLGVGKLPYISRIHTAYIGEYLHFGYLKSLVSTTAVISHKIHKSHEVPLNQRTLLEYVYTSFSNSMIQ